MKNKAKVDYGESWAVTAALIRKRDDYTCQICGKKFPPFSPLLHVHHKIPLSQGGTNDSNNLITLCIDCHKDQHPHMQKKTYKVKKRKILKR